MALLTAGYWPTTYWPSSYWADDYWPDYGTNVVVSVKRAGSRDHDLMLEAYQRYTVQHIYEIVEL